MMKEELRIIYQYESLEECADIWISLCSILQQENLLSERYDIDEIEFQPINEVEKILRKETNFSINDQRFSFSYGAVWAGKLHQLIIAQQQSEKVNWDVWIEKLSNNGLFVNAWKFDNDYIYWQNNKNIESYKWNRKSYEHLPMKPSGDPLPFAQTVIDTSKNPGRNVFRTGYVEAVGSTMWLGDEFFSLTGADKDNIISSDWLDASEIKPGIIKIKAQEECFIQSDGKEAELQYKMRDLLYPNND